MSMRESPRIRRLRSDRKALDQLQSESSIFRFDPVGTQGDYYKLWFHGRGLWRPDAQAAVHYHERHEVHVRLGASYPRMMPELGWKTPIFHPNISASGVVCLGGYGTYWVPSLTLDELCGMLWDMIRYDNYDEKSPYNRDAAQWVKTQSQYHLPVDPRPLRDRLAGYVPQTVPAAKPIPQPAKPVAAMPRATPPVATPARRTPLAHTPRATPAPRAPIAANDDVIFLDERHIISPAAARPARSDEILFIE
jgi:ubiquitin-protein ligase